MKIYQPITIFINIFILAGINAHAKDALKFGTHLQKPSSSVITDRWVAACKEVGLTCTVEEMPGKRALAAANAGETDGDTSRLKNIKELSPEDTGNLIMINEPIMEEDVALVTKDSTSVADVNWDNINKLKRIAFVRGAKLIEKNVKPDLQMATQDLKTTFAALAEGRAEAVIVQRVSANQHISENKLTGYKVHAKPVAKNIYFTWLHNSNKDMIPKLEDGLKKIKANGKYAEISKKYLAGLE